MNALANLTAANNRLATAVDKLVEAWNVPNPTEAAIQAEADRTNAQAERIEKLLNPAPENPA